MQKSTHSIPHIISSIDAIQSRISLAAIQEASRSAQAFEELQGRIGAQIRSAGDDIHARLAERGLSAGDLAIRSRRAYQWLRFLSQPGCLAAHLDALQRVNLFLPGIQSRRPARQAQLRLRFYHQGALYQVRSQEKTIDLKVQESFVAAPDTILTALLEIALQPPAAPARQLVKDYTFNREYQALRQKLEYLELAENSFTAGRSHHLVESFSRVNQTYFAGDLPQPNLAWSKRLTFRKFGHYQWDTDTVMISSSLDQPHIPPYVLDYVMYHELLHKKLGARKTNLNRVSHTREFKEEESKYREFKQAKHWLNRVARSLARSRS